ncbi:MHC class I polypeptide-related sequence B precursor [Pan troglodytes]|uniref:MHC class I related protein n=6 Tax=Pan troglodytes TaxID=9598 RepID=Q85ZX5_PANTR|nr:MHC class I polypeptide-related sequence B precursor [Pan troglodytes]BAB83887.1 MHC class I related protein [Pan troglodytes]BAC78162.1 stress inducible class I homologue, gamma delta-TCR and NKG2D ligand [Pan troglodytes]
MGLGPVLLFLAGIFHFAPPGAAAEPHSLHYNLTVLSRDGSVQSGFLAEVHLDGQPFLRCDRQKCRAKPQGQWAEDVLGNKTWDRETGDLTENGKDLRMTLAHIKDQKGGLHSLQEIRVCEIHEDSSTRSSWHFYYDGELFLSQNLETQKWTAPQSSRAQTLAMNVTNFWKKEAMKTKTHYRAMQADCWQKLKRYLESGVVLRRTVPPMVNVTRSEASEGNITVTCWASSFYPRNITLTWRQDGISLSHNAQQWGDVLPDGNGTYQTWVATRICQGEEQRFTCYVEHSGNHGTHPVPSGKALVLQSQRTEFPYVPVVMTCFVIIIILCVPCCKKKTSVAEGPELVSLQVLDQHPVGTGDHRDAAQLGFQPLMSAPGSTGSTEGA